MPQAGHATVKHVLEGLEAGVLELMAEAKGVPLAILWQRCGHCKVLA